MGRRGGTDDHGHAHICGICLARGNKNLLIGEAVEPEEEQQIAAFLERHDAVKEVFDVLTVRLGT